MTNIQISLNWFVSNSEVIRNVAQTLQSIVTIVGIFATAIWFLRKRQIQPKAIITHKITHHCIHSNMLLNNKILLIRIIAKIENIGNVLIKIDHVEARINWVSPIIEDVIYSIQEAERFENLQINFPGIYSKKVDLKKGEIIVIEPGESDEIYCDFIHRTDKYPEKIKTIMIYFYARNIKSHGQLMGWSFEECYNFDDRPENGEF
ncbi:hypothetical protein [Microcystis aeruginosa]|nr:hypothetical protein [Microcystis aeruginosa]TRT98836.1 MAG: hypothetical protein EWV61_16650 [Microcystis aeruginosa Ma_AC_P_19900807_S300]UGS10228.1 hypothetical protein LRR78_06080 [Microcystis aeruginosa FACHB-905 = DIANCHI905]WKX61315.1 hypothetical protein Q3H53_001220 [Microcystis aeruginosa PCC 7806]